MTKIAHISDLHFGRDIPRVCDSLLQSLTSIDPDLVVVSGDLTQRARSREFAAARRFLGELPWPKLVVPGNHDLAAFNPLARFALPWRAWSSHLQLPLEPTHEAGGHCAAGINTARRLPRLLDWSRGCIDRSQLQQIGTQMPRQAAHKLRLLVAHHPFWLPIPQKKRKLIGGRDDALEALTGMQVDMILSGHVHVAYSRVYRGIVISHAGTTTSDRTLPGHPNSFNLISGDRRNLEVATMSWNGSCFQEHEKRLFERRENSWHENKVNTEAGIIT